MIGTRQFNISGNVGNNSTQKDVICVIKVIVLFQVKKTAKLLKEAAIALILKLLRA